MLSSRLICQTLIKRCAGNLPGLLPYRVCFSQQMFVTVTYGFATVTCSTKRMGDFLSMRYINLHYLLTTCLCGSLAQCALSLKRLSAGPGFNPQTRLNKLFQDYWRACFEINFSGRQEGLTVSSIICVR